MKLHVMVGFSAIATERKLVDARRGKYGVTTFIPPTSTESVLVHSNYYWSTVIVEQDGVTTKYRFVRPVRVRESTKLYL